MNLKLILVKNSGQTRAFSLPSIVTTIGRKHCCDLRVPLMAVSRKHCQIYHDNGTLKIRDLGSRNGTIINGNKIEDAQVQAGDIIEIGTLKFVMQIDDFPDEESIQIEQEGKRLAKKTKEPAVASSGGEVDEDLDNFFSSQNS